MPNIPNRPRAGGARFGNYRGSSTANGRGERSPLIGDPSRPNQETTREIQAPVQLITKKCQPCERGVDPCTLDESNQQLEKLPGWYLTHDGQRIRKDWTVKHFMAGMNFFNTVAEIAEEDGHHPDLHLEG